MENYAVETLKQHSNNGVRIIRLIPFMIRSILLLAFLAIYNNTFGQIASVAFDSGPVYLNTDAYLVVAVSNVDCDSVYLSSKEGSFGKHVSCRYTFKPKVLGPGTIYIHYILDGDTILTGGSSFEILLQPSPKALISDKETGSVGKDFFGKAKKISGSFFVPVKRWLPCEIESFQVIITRKDTVLFSHYNAKSSFDKKALAAFKKLKTDDRVSFINILGCLDNMGGYLNNIGFSVK